MSTTNLKIFHESTMKKSRFLSASVVNTAIMLGVLSLAGCKKADDVDVTENITTLTEITWDELIPADFEQPENPFETMSQDEIDKLMDGSEESRAIIEQLEKEFYYAPTVDKLDGMRVKLPAYITPLEFDGQMKLEEFLLVPYLGACMHTPPPPSNQIVHATPSEAVEVDDMYSPVWAIGRLRVDTKKSALAEAGYQLELEDIEPYKRLQ